MRVGRFAMEDYADLVARGYWARVVRCAVPVDAKWGTDAEATLSWWDDISNEGWDSADVDAPIWRRHVALKVLRPEHVGRPGFNEAFVKEARILQALMPLRSVNPLLEMGYATATVGSSGTDFETRPAKTVEEFEAGVELERLTGGVPYLALGFVPGDQSLFAIASAVTQEGVMSALPLQHKLEFAEAIFAFLATSQARGVYYLDHKPEHVYWLRGSAACQIAVIDFNSSRLGEQNVADAEKDVMNAFAALAYPLFASWALSDNPVMPRIATSVDVPDLTTGAIWDPTTGLVRTHGREGFAPELADETLRMILSWGLSRDGGTPDRRAFADQLASRLGVERRKLDSSRGVALVAVELFGAYQAKLRSHSKMWEMLEEYAFKLEGAQREIDRVRRSCERMINVADGSQADIVLQRELMRMHDRVERFWRGRVLP